MKAPEHIVIFHPAAIGDTVLATPVAKILKINFPNARLTYWAHPTLRIILEDMCPDISGFVAYERAGINAQRSRLKQLHSDLFVDLSGSLKGRLIPLFTTRSVHYRKQSRNASYTQHAVDNFIDTIDSLCKERPDPLFPTVFPGDGKVLMERTLSAHNLKVASNSAKLPIIALVPGVGRVRPSRAWPLERWRELIGGLLERNSHFPVIIGGADDKEDGEHLEQEFAGQIVNLCGKLALDETATFLSECDLVISGDTGPAHIAVAVGTPVIGLYGPTLSGRSGPYGCEKLIITNEQSCRCQTEKVCRFASAGSSGECISSITAAQVLERIEQALRVKQLDEG